MSTVGAQWQLDALGHSQEGSLGMLPAHTREGKAVNASSATFLEHHHHYFRITGGDSKAQRQVQLTRPKSHSEPKARQSFVPGTVDAATSSGSTDGSFSLSMFQLRC